MVCPSTKCEPSSRIACRVASRTVGAPSRLTRLSTMPSGVSPGWMTRAVTPSVQAEAETRNPPEPSALDRKSTRLNSSHQIISYAVFCLKKKKKTKHSAQDAHEH